jgi:hypothetical protein
VLAPRCPLARRRPRPTPLVAGLAALGLWLGSGCATEQAAERPAPQQPPTAPFAETRSSGKLLAETQAQNNALKDELEELDRRIGSALSAINWNLRRYPECIDALFHTAAELDLGSRSLVREQAALAAEIDALTEARAAGTLRLDELQRVSNRVQVAHDRVSVLNAELALLFSRTMRRDSPCEEAA